MRAEGACGDAEKGEGRAGAEEESIHARDPL
jgi:hypothetical protein